jgi:uncharacterized protein
MLTTPPSCRRVLPWRRLARIIAVLMTAYCAVVLILLAMEKRLVFHPVPASQRWIEPPTGCDVQDVEFPSADGTRLHARWYPCVGAKGAVLICHSRSGNLSLEIGPADVAGWHHEMASSVLIFDYPGYGRSAGSPSEAGCYAAASAAHGWLTHVHGVPSHQVLIYGRSLGSAVAVELASRQPHRALILVSPLTSLPDVVLSQVPLVPAHWLMRNRFDSLARIARCAQPVFIVHGTDDRLVPFAQGEALFAAVRGRKQLLAVDGARHGNCLTAAFYPALRCFLNDWKRKDE